MFISKPASTYSLHTFFACCTRVVAAAGVILFLSTGTAHALLTPSTTTVTSSLNPAPTGLPVTFTATVTGAGGTPSGSVILLSGSIQLGTGVLVNGSAAFTVPSTSLLLGSNEINAEYLGDQNFLPSISLGLTQTVVSTLPTVTSLISSANPSSFGQAIKLTAAVTANGLVPTGIVTFLDGNVSIGVGALAGGAVRLTMGSLSVGTHTITAVYGGGTGLQNSTSLALMQTVNKAASTVGVDSPCMRTFVGGQPFTLNATVSGQTPGGTLTFNNGDGGTLCGNSVNLTGDAASCTSSALVAQGSATETVFNLTASYNGDVNNESSTSASLAITVLSAADVVFRNDYEPVLANCPIE